MQTHPSIRVALLTLALTPACGSSGSSSTRASADEIASYRELAIEVQSAATDYQAAMQGADMTTIEACQRVHEQYDAEVRPLVTQMGGMSEGMDGFMDQHGGGAMMDLACATDGMLAELDRHHGAACSLPDLSADQAEATRHVNVMTADSTHLSDRASEMMGAAGGGTATWGPMMMGCQGYAGSGTMTRGGGLGPLTMTAGARVRATTRTAGATGSRREFLQALARGGAILAAPAALSAVGCQCGGGSGGALEESGAGNAGVPPFTADREFVLRGVQTSAPLLPGKTTEVWTFRGQVLSGPAGALSEVEGGALGPGLPRATRSKASHHV